jgi:hypothetical protein
MESVNHALKEQEKVFMERTERSLSYTVGALSSSLIPVLCNLNVFLVPHSCLSFVPGGKETMKAIMLKVISLVFTSFITMWCHGGV